MQPAPMREQHGLRPRAGRPAALPAVSPAAQPPLAGQQLQAQALQRRPIRICNIRLLQAIDTLQRKLCGTCLHQATDAIRYCGQSGGACRRRHSCSCRQTDGKNDATNDGHRDILAA